MTKPQWALIMEKADRLMRESHRLDEVAEGKRCPALESGGIRCTADAEPAHQHRHDPKDVPS